MLDIKKLREAPHVFKNQLSRRGDAYVHMVDQLIASDMERRKLLAETESLKSKKRALSAEVGELKKLGEKSDSQMEKVREINRSIKKLDEGVNECETELRSTLLEIPNLPMDDVPDGANDAANREERIWGIKPVFDFQIKNHVQVGESLDILDLKRAAKISGARFAVYKGPGAQMIRALIAFMIDVHTKENGYQELYPPFMVNVESMTGTGQLPKFEEDLFKLRDDPFYLIPTAEVPITNYHRDEVLNEEDLPIKYTAYTPCFRREAGSYGKDTVGLIRQHQFDKVELVKFTTPKTSSVELEYLVANAEKILQKLGLHYRVVTLCTGDLGFSSSKTYDLEVWLPSQNNYREISSCSNFTDYQARRAKIRFKGKYGGKPELVHTLNGSGLAVGRLFVAILENFQQEDGSVLLPESLRSYMHGAERITK
tara:strand:- start:810 stop:2090 length:1281 start_codon:yes stop_codon:yes gene_type:complete